MAVAAISNMNLHQALTIGLAIAGVVIVALLGAAAIARYRKGLLKDSPQATGPWNLDDLREMRDSGQLTDQEYQLLRQRLIHGSMDAKGPARRKPNPPANSTDDMGTMT